MNADEIGQALVTAVILGSLWGLLGSGFGTILGVTGRFNFAFSTSILWGAYIAVALQEHSVPLVFAALGGVVVGALIGVVLELVVFRPLVNRAPATALLAVFVSSLGVVILGQAILELMFGSNTKVLLPGFAVKRIAITQGVGFTTLDVVTVAVCLVLILAFDIFLDRTRFGRAVRAVRENPEMAMAVGVHPEAVYVFVFAVGSGMAGVGGILLALRGAASPDMGIGPTFTALVVMFLSGLSSRPLRFLVGGLFVAAIQSLVAIWLSPLWTPAVTFGVLFIYIALLPYVAGRRLRLPRIRVQGHAAVTDGS